ncbi:MAG: hypothetical protein LVR00_04585 [Rhabdochlamydiaceae bacterium]|jgi:hypothetical protein
MSLLKVSHPSQEGVLNVSKWLKTQVLLSGAEMRQLFAHLAPCALYNVSELVPEGEIPQELFLETYAQYAEILQAGKILEPRRLFSGALSATPDAFYKMEVKAGQYLIKTIQPVVQMQLHQFLPSKLDGKFHPMVLSQDSVSWGVQFSYPQICQDPKTNLFSKVSEQFPNTLLFDKLTKWLRNFSTPTTFIWEGKKTAVPIRLGKECFSWINRHPQLQEKGIQVHVY